MCVQAYTLLSCAYVYYKFVFVFVLFRIHILSTLLMKIVTLMRKCNAAD
jgi:hypothetical protein